MNSRADSRFLPFLFLILLGCVPYDFQEFPLPLVSYWETSANEIVNLSESEGYLVIESFTLSQEGATPLGSSISETLLGWSEPERIQPGHFQILLNGQSHSLFHLETNPLYRWDQAVVNSARFSHQSFELTQPRARALGILDPLKLMVGENEKLEPGGLATRADLLLAMGNYEILEFSYQDAEGNLIQFSKGQEEQNNSELRLKQHHTLNSLDFHFQLLSSGLFGKKVEFQPKALSKTGELIWNQYNFAPAEVSENLSFAYYQGRILIEYSWYQGSIDTHSFEVLLERLPGFP